MRKLFILLFVMVGSLSANAQYTGFKPLTNPDLFIKQFSSASEKLTTIKSDFTQEKNMQMLSDKIVSKGKFWFKKDNLMRMEYVSPFKYLVIINKNTVYIKDGEKENKISAGSNKLFKQINKLMIDCVSGSVLNSKDYKAKVFEGNGLFLVEMSLLAKNLKDMFSTIRITIDKKDFSVNKIEMNEASGDNTILIFHNKELNTNISDAVFSIK